MNPISVTWVCSESEKKKKARLVARGFQDEPLPNTSTVSPTCRKESLRLMFVITASNGWDISSLDISSAFLQGKKLDRIVYLIPPKEYGTKNVLWKLNKCVYGLSDAARMWYDVVKETVQSAGIEKCPHDDAFFYWKGGTLLQGTMSIHVDDFIYGGTEAFKRLLNDSVLNQFLISSHQEGFFTHLGLEIIQNDSDKSISITQQNYIRDDLKPIQLTNKRRNQKSHALDPNEYKLFKSLCGKLLWLSLQTRPDISFDVCQLSNHLADPNVQDIIQMNKLIKKLQNEPNISLYFKPIDFKAAKLKVYSDAAYANLPKHGSQCGYIIFLSDIEDKVENPIAWKSVKIDRVCQSALSAEGLALVKAVDHAIFIQETVKSIINSQHGPLIECYIDSKSLHEILLKTKDPEEKRLICILAPLRDSISHGEITIFRIDSKQMPADILTKRGVNGNVMRSHLERSF